MAPAAGIAYSPASHRGIALIIGLVILAILSMIGVAAFSVSTQEERMAGNSRDRIRAFEAAEAALRECEEYVKGNPPLGGGIYLAPPSTQATQAETIDWNAAGAVRAYTGPSNPDWSQPPVCIAETFQVQHGSPGTGNAITQWAQMAHVTAQGYGLNRNTVVRLESYYAM